MKLEVIVENHTTGELVETSYKAALPVIRRWMMRGDYLVIRSKENK